jgi:23S rRNA pseudouridine1911/1915/1917 synthase
MTREDYAASNEDSGKRLDVFISEKSGLTRSRAQNIIEKGLVSVNLKKASKSLKIKSGDIVSADFPEPEKSEIVPENIPLDIVYEDDCLLVVNKPKGMVVHPAPGHYSGTLVNALLYHCGSSLSGINGVVRPGIVHRIDKDTSGLLAVAKNDEAHIGLAEQIKAHSFKREYYAVVVGHFKEPSGTIDLPIGRSPKDRKKQEVNGLNARKAVTHYETLEDFDGFSLVKFKLETGRTHQIRVHASYKGHPVAGDAVYGDSRHTFGLDGQCLHAKVLGFIHPITKEYMEFDSELPEYFTEFLEKIRRK